MPAINLVRDAARAMIELGPSLAVNVLLVFLATAVVTWAGYQVWQIAGSVSPHPRVEESRHPADVLLMSYMWGALYSLLLMYCLGATGFYSQPMLWIGVFLPILARGRKSFVLPISMRKPGWRALPFFVLTAGPLLISLTCPVPSWMDVLEGNIAPIQRLVTFSTFDPASALPSALYPVNRATPLYTGFFGLLARLTDLDAYEVLAAALVPTLLMTLLAAYRLGQVLSPQHRDAGWLAAASWVLTYQYLHVQGSRSTVWQMTFALIALARAVELYRRPGNLRIALECAVAAAAGVLAHPFEGMFTVLAVLLIAVTVWWSDSFRNTRNYLVAIGAGVAAGAPLLWTWWPRNNVALVTGLLLLALIPLILRQGRIVDGASDLSERTFKWRGIFVALPAFAAASALALEWDFFAWGRQSFLIQQLVGFPVPAGLTLALIVLSIRKASAPALFAGAAILAASLPLWLIPYLELHPVTIASFRFEFPLKGMDFWLSPLLAVSASALMVRLWADAPRRRLARAYVLAVLILPTSALLRQDPQHSAGGLYAMTKWQLQLAARGYWRGWGDPRRIVSAEDRELFTKLRSMVNDGTIGPDDYIDHVAPRSNLMATPFPAFTGISQNLYLPAVDTADVHTHDGRLYDIDEVSPQGRLILVEKSMLSAYPVDPSWILYENDRVLLARRPTASPPS
ncbi:MAG: hypothetical protein ACSLFK_08415 [Gemmatimonadaceae bacterium]